ncbi:hypothetical protein V8E36_001293 [Tilletia maclaganii]
MLAPQPFSVQSCTANGTVPASWVPRIRRELDMSNPLLARFQMIKDIVVDVPSAAVRTQNQGSRPGVELASILRYGAVAEHRPRYIYVNVKSAKAKGMVPSHYIATTRSVTLCHICCCSHRPRHLKRALCDASHGQCP